MVGTEGVEKTNDGYDELGMNILVDMGVICAAFQRASGGA